MASLNDAPLSKEEQEEEEMRDELKDVGLYYENMDVKEMRQLIDVLNESKNDCRKFSEDTVDDPTLFNETSRSVQDSPKITENSTLRPIPSFSYKQAALSGALETQNSSLQESKNSNDKNSQASSSNSCEKNYTGNSSDSESIYDKNSNFKKDQDYPPLATNRYKTRSTTAADGPRTRSQEKKLSLPNAKKSSLERWMLNPLEFKEDKNTNPLRQPPSNLEESFSYCSEDIDFDSEEFDKLCQQMNEKLSALNQRCIVESAPSDKKSTPIKINYEDSPASKLPVKEKSFPINSQGSATPTRSTYDRATKRKALSTIAAGTTYENDENSDDDSSNTKKRKFQQGKKEEEGVKRNPENQKNKNIGKSIEMINIDDSKDSLDLEFDNSDLHKIRRNANINISTDNGSDEQQSQYPRRIEPPNPAKKNFKGPRAKNKNSTQTEKKFDSEKKQMLNDEEIKKTLQAIDEQIDDNDCVEITNDIRPPPTPKRINKKLQQAASLLENAREQTEQQLKVEEEAKEQRKKEERLKMDERISSRLQEQENEDAHRLENQRKLNEQTAFYNNILDSRSRVTRSNFKSKRTEEEIAEDLLLEGDDDEPTVTKVIHKQLCPICQKPYPDDIIQTHASGCDAYATDSDDVYNRPSTSRRFAQIYKCHYCDVYETDNGKVYEDHVVYCKNRNGRVVNGSWISK